MSARRARFMEWFTALRERARLRGLLLEHPTVRELARVDQPELRLL